MANRNRAAGRHAWLRNGRILGPVTVDAGRLCLRRSTSGKGQYQPYEEVTPMTTGVEQELPGLRKQNGATIGRLLANGNLGRAEEGPDGRMHARIRIPPDELVWDPEVLVMPHGGDLELELINDDMNTHCALLPSNGDSQFIWLVNHSRGTATINLDGPGYYWFSSPTGNDEGRGLTGAIVVMGEAPPEARLDRPKQPRP
jgi:PQQ system protein